MPQLADDLAAVREVGVKTKKVHPMSKRENLCFLIEFQTKRCHKCLYFREAILQIFFVRVDEEKVIHVSAIVADMELFFYKVVKLIQIVQGKQLACLITKRQTV